MLWANAGVGAQLALFNGGSLRDAVPSAYQPQDQALSRPGKGAAPWSVVVGDVYNALNLSNTEIVVRLSGQDIWAVRCESRGCGESARAMQALENGVSTLSAVDGAAAPSDGRFPQIAGFKFTYSYLQPVGSRVLRCVD